VAGKRERDRASYNPMFCAENITPHLRTAGENTRNCQPGGYFHLYVQGFTLRAEGDGDGSSNLIGVPDSSNDMFLKECA